MIKTRLLGAAQFLLLALYLLGGFGVLVLAVVRSGDWGALAAPGLDRLGDPKDAIPFGWDSMTNPFAWIFGIARLTAMLVVPVVTLGVLLGGFAVAGARRDGDGRRLRRALLAIGVWLALAAVAFTPYGGDLHTWLAD
ncbi:hypothetical protein Aph02nite_13340 [Actinoplanes philippinensis]|uniref:Uncharacterized protein n=1 Tax=Actinoplanes philippinensis TaxID=35752 RepID=A0A1I1ZNI9_9ACTN|nr:hypothetical protein [Actinoplanes philippinensis]GIE75384.1 hypothetical protein Aph02nite_13340 [Actinoplanes philippinensis]SFE33215.1 hypothetical protein SAMN05421541_101204 [Actinoplanes philippinensis]